MTSTTPADWIAAEIEAGRTELQPMLDRSPYPTTAIRTVAETGDFRIVDGHVRRVEPDPDTWFSDRLIDGRFHLPVRLTEQLLAGEGVRAPMALANVLAIPRGGFTSLTSEQGPLPMRLIHDYVLTGPITKFLSGKTVGDTVDIIFGQDGTVEVR